MAGDRYEQAWDVILLFYSPILFRGTTLVISLRICQRHFLSLLKQIFRHFGYPDTSDMYLKETQDSVGPDVHL